MKIMKKSYLRWGILGALGFLVIAGMGTYSLWFLHAATDSLPGDYSVGYTHGLIASYPETSEALLGRISVSGTVLGQYASVVYRKGGDGEYLVGVPRLVSQRSVRYVLEKDGWQVRRMGWIIFARKGGGENQQLHILRAMLRMGSAISIHRLPFHPIFIAHLDTHDDTRQQFSVYVSRQHAGVHAVINTRSSIFFSGSHARIKADSNNIETSYVSIQRDVLQRITPDFLRMLEKEVRHSLGFQKTQPEVASELANIGTVSVALGGGDNDFAIGAFSASGAVADHITAWIAAEQGNRHPAKRAFSLPDRTIAYEYVQGKSNAYFDLNKEKNSCMPSENYDEKIFLCGEGPATVIATSDTAGKMLLDYMKDAEGRDRGIIQGKALRAMGLEKIFQTIEYAGSEDVIDVWGDFRTGE